jgi:cysteinyl-tRNA synthetase
MANTWMHNGFLQVEGEKMSKSLGNFVTINELLTSSNFGGHIWEGHVLRLAMLRTHYRQPIDWTARSLGESFQTIKNWANILARHNTSFTSDEPPPSTVIAALLDDLNTPMAIAEMHKLAETARKGALHAAQDLHQAGKFLGIFTHALMSAEDLTDIGQAAGELLPDQEQQHIKSLVDARNVARNAKNFKEADRIRDELKEMGVELKDSKDGTTWEIER